MLVYGRNSVLHQRKARVRSSLETKDLELVEKFLMFQLFYTLCRTNNKVRMYMCVYEYVYIDGIYMIYLCVDIIYMCIYMHTHIHRYMSIYINFLPSFSLNL